MKPILPHEATLAVDSESFLSLGQHAHISIAKTRRIAVSLSRKWCERGHTLDAGGDVNGAVVLRNQRSAVGNQNT